MIFTPPVVVVESLTSNKKEPLVGNLNNSGYLQCWVRRSDDANQKGYLAHRFPWECNNCPIPNGYVIDHINDNKMVDNGLKNLQLLKSQENTQKYHNEHFLADEKLRQSVWQPIKFNSTPACTLAVKIC